LHSAQATIDQMVKRKKAGDSPKPRADDRHLNPRVAFHLPQSWLNSLNELRRSRKPRATLTGEILLALEGHFERHGIRVPLEDLPG
jgi:hypothetical protein